MDDLKSNFKKLIKISQTISLINFSIILCKHAIWQLPLKMLN